MTAPGIHLMGGLSTSADSHVPVNKTKKKNSTAFMSGGLIIITTCVQGHNGSYIIHCSLGYK